MGRRVPFSATLAALLSILAFLAAPGAASAQQVTGAVVVSSCGTPPTTYAAGSAHAVLQDTTGLLCTNATGGGGGAVTIANGDDQAEGAKADPACTTDTGTCSVIALIKRTNQNTAGAIPAGTNTIGGVVPTASASGGATSYGLQATASTNSTSVKGSAGTLYGLNLENTTTTIYYLRMYDASSAPTCSSATNFTRTWPIPPAASSGLVGGIAAGLPATGVAFSNGIAFCVTGGPSSTDNTNAASGVFVNLDYK